jgi:hypothetical protein
MKPTASMAVAIVLDASTRTEIPSPTETVWLLVIEIASLGVNCASDVSIVTADAPAAGTTIFAARSVC